MSQARPLAPDPEAEREVDLRTVWARLADRWWLPVAALVAGAVVGVLVSVGSGQTWRAQTLLYLGQPFTVQGGGQIQSLATNPRTVSEIIRSEFALKQASEKSGLRVGQLRGHVTSQAVTAVGQTRITSPLVEISVNGPVRVKAEKASDALAQSVIDQVSTYVIQKIKLLNDQIAASQKELSDIDARVTSLQNQLQTIITSKTLSPTDRLIASGNITSTIGFQEQRRGTVQQELFQNQQLLSLAINVEKSKIVQPAAASRVTATSRRNSALIGALIGLILGGLAAYLADPLLARRNTARVA
jgi:Chain length determinant protein